MADDYADRLARYDRIIDQLQGFVAQQMVMNARLERRHEDHEATLAHHAQELEELRALSRAQEAHNQALYVMHEEVRLAVVDLRAAFTTLNQRLARIEGLLEQNLRGGENGRNA